MGPVQNADASLSRLQFFAVPDAKTIKRVSGDSTKVYSWFPGQMCHILHLCGPEKYGGKGNIRLKAEEEASRTGKPYEEIAEQVNVVTTTTY